MREVEVRLVDMEGAVRRSLPEAVVDSVSWVLNNYGQAQYHMSTHSAAAVDAAKLHVRDWEVQIWMDGDLVWWGIPMTDGGGPGEMSIGADELFAHFEDRINDIGFEWAGVDQFTILQDLVEYAQDETDQNFRDFNIGFYSPTGPSGINRFQRYVRSEHGIIANLIRDWAKVKNGVEFEVQYTEDGQRLFVPYSPKRGQVRNDLLLEFGKNVPTYTWNRTAVSMRTQTYAVGGAIPNSQLGKMEQVYEEPLSSAIYGVIQSVFSEGSQMDPDYLLDKATKDVLRYNRPETKVTVPALSVNDTQFFGELKPGDWVPVRIVDGYRAFEGQLRVGKITWTPDELLQLEFIDEDVTA